MGELNDLRLLKLAELYEMAYESFIHEIALRVVEDDEIRVRLMKLVDPTDRHGERIVEQIERLNKQLGAPDKVELVRAALLDVRDVERMARDFYTGHLDQVHDPAVARLFRQLAHEEERHRNIAEEIILFSDRKRGRVTPRAGDVQTLRLLSEHPDGSQDDAAILASRLTKSEDGEEKE